MILRCIRWNDGRGNGNGEEDTIILWGVRVYPILRDDEPRYQRRQQKAESLHDGVFEALFQFASNGFGLHVHADDSNLSLAQQSVGK